MNSETPLTASVREPQQGRSRASFERMIAAAEKLMAERGSDEFTLSDVAKVGKVSIGSIYCRFDSKDDLVRVVQVRVLDRVDAEQFAGIEAARTGAGDLVSLVYGLVENFAETMRKHADVMRPLMQRASTDPVVAATGKERYARAAAAVHTALLEHRSEIKHPDPDRAVASAFRILYAAVARYLGFGTAVGAAWEGDWTILKEDLEHMIAAFLTSPPRPGAAG